MKKFRISIGENLTTAIAETLEAGNSHIGNLRTEAIPIAQLILDPQNARDLAINFTDLPHGPQKNDPQYDRKQKEFEELQTFAEEIKIDGIIQPIVVYSENGKFHVISGERRSLSSMIAGKTHIPAIIRTKPSDEYKLARIQWNENLQRKNLNLWERLQGINRLIKSYQHDVDSRAEITPTLISRLANFSLRRAMDYHLLLSTDNKKLLTAIKNEEINNVEKAVAIIKENNDSSKSKEKYIGPPEQTVPKNIKVAGRQATQVNLGKTKNTKVVRVFYDLISNDSQLQDISQKLEAVDWDNYKQVSKLFTRMIHLLEKKV